MTGNAFTTMFTQKTFILTQQVCGRTMLSHCPAIQPVQAITILNSRQAVGYHNNSQTLA